jgi:hypothetical protein
LIPAIVAVALLAMGAAVAGVALPASRSDAWLLGALLIGLLLLYRATRRFVLLVPEIPEEAIAILAIGSGLALAVELAMFGVPLFGQVAYDEFGFPGLHHLAVAQWILPLFARRNRAWYLAYALLAAVLLFSRQMALHALIAYLIATRFNPRQFLAIVVIGFASIFALGYYRNLVIGADLSSDIERVLQIDTYGVLDFVVLYMVGPYVSTLATSNTDLVRVISDYWNTFPEWYMFSTLTGVPPLASLVLFYALVSAIAIACNRSGSWSLQLFSMPFHIISIFCFFSHVLFTTPVIVLFLILFAGTLTGLRPRGSAAAAPDADRPRPA